MNAPLPTPAPGSSKALRSPLILLMLFLPALLRGQSVPVSVNGIVSTFGVTTVIYNGQYAMHITDFGFFWLDTAALTAGHVQAISNCSATTAPPSDSGFWTIGDCNSITNISSSGSTVLVRAIGAQCGNLQKGCGGPRELGHNLLLFNLGGDWRYLGDAPSEEITPYPDSTQMADPQGRTWQILPADNTGRNYIWSVNGGVQTTPTPTRTPTPTPTSGPPVANASATNLSAQARGDSTNYFGDKFQLAEGPNTLTVAWDINYTNGVFAQDLAPNNPGSNPTITGYFPCEPANNGNFPTGAGCMASLGLSNPSSGSFAFAENASNRYGQSANTFVSSPISFLCPQAGIVGYTGSSGTCSKSGGTLTVIAGGSADASPSKGNLTDASFAWNFTGSNPISVQGMIVGVPAGDTGFTLTITFPGGYTATATGSIVQINLVAAFTISPNPVLKSSPALTFTNRMQKASATTLNSVDYQIASGACSGQPLTGYSVLANSTTNSGFLAAGGTASVNAPPTTGNYCAYLRYNYSPSDASQPQIVSNALTVTDSTPVLGIYTDPGASTLATLGGSPTAWQLRANTTYYLKDIEATPPGSVPFFFNNGSGDVSIGTSNGIDPLPWTPQAQCSSGCSIKIFTAAFAVVISPAAAPTPVPSPTPPFGGGGGGGGSLTATAQVPTTGSLNTPISVSAFASGGSPPYSYSWACDFNQLNPGSGFVSGGSSFSCSYSTSGTHLVVVKVTDSVAAVAISSPQSISISGGGGGSSLNVTAQVPATGTRGAAVVVSASAIGGTPPYSYSFNCDFNQLNPNAGFGAPQSEASATCSYSTNGAHLVVVRATDATNTSGISSPQTITISEPAGPPQASAAFAVTVGGTPVTPSGSCSAPGGSTLAYTLFAGKEATFTAGETNAKNWGWVLGDGTVAAGKTVPHTYGSQSVGSLLSGSLYVYADGSKTIGDAACNFKVNVVLPPPSADVSISGADRNPDGSYQGEAGKTIVFTANETNASNYVWDFGDGGPGESGLSEKSTEKVYSKAGIYTVKLTVTGDGKSTVGSTPGNVVLNIGPSQFRAVIVPGAAHLDDGTTTWGTDVSITNGGISPMNVSLGFVSYDSNAPASQDLSQLSYAAPVALDPGGSYSVADVVKVLGGSNNQGTLVIKYEGGTRAPYVTARVYFQPKNNPGNLSYGSGLSVYEVDGSGKIAPQGFVSVALSGSPRAAGTESLGETLDYSVTVSLTGSGTGTVSSNPPGISCPPTCSASFTPGDNISLSASAAAGSTFVDFVSGCDFKPLGQCALSINGPKNVVARFDSSGPPPATNFNLLVSKRGTGTGTVSSSPAGISCDPLCNAAFPQGTSVTLTASADPGSSFTGWSGDCSGVGPCVVTMSAARSVSANFTSGPPSSGNFTLTVARAGTASGTVTSAPAGINCGAACSASFAQGTSVTLTATPEFGATFAGWSGACSGSGACSLTMSSDQSVTATFNQTPATTQGDQLLIGMRSDARYRFVVTLYNAGGSSGDVELKATNDKGIAVAIRDGGNRVTSRKFTLRPYQQVYLRDGDLGLDDGRDYVLKATKTSATGTLLAFGTALDKKTNDLIQVIDDSQASPTDSSGFASYWLAGVSRYDSSYGARWRTDLRIFNRGSNPRNLYFEYTYFADGAEHVAHVDNISIDKGQLLTWDDVIGTLLSQSKEKDVDLTKSNAGILRVYYVADDESKSKPLMIGSRNYDDQPTGTSGSQLPIYTVAQTATASQKLFLTGAEESDRYRSLIGFFTPDPGPVAFHVSVLDEKGKEVGSFVTQLGGSGGHWGQLDLTSSIFNFQNPGKPVSIRVDQISGGRLAAYAFTVDKVTLDTNFIQGIPQN